MQPFSYKIGDLDLAMLNNKIGKGNLNFFKLIKLLTLLSFGYKIGD